MWPPALFPFNGTQRRDSSKFCNMFWVMDSDMVIDDHPNEPVLMTAGTWKDRKGPMEFMTGRTWHYHSMNDYALRWRSSVLHRFWRDHISDKNGRRGNVPPNALAALAVRDDRSGQGGRME